MTTAERKAVTEGYDADLIAIRNLLARHRRPDQEAVITSDTQRQQHVMAIRQLAEKTAASRIQPVPREMAHPVPVRVAEVAVEPDPAPPTPSVAARVALPVVRRARSYRPRTKVILGTSLVLLLILHPVAMLGWSLVALTLTFATYLIVGEERFWRAVIVLYQRVARINPDAARRLKLRAQLAARKWNRWVQWLPQGLADTLQAPNVRALILADARHDAVLTERLSRLDRDGDA